MAAKRRRGKRTRAQKMQGTLAIGGVFALLVGINVYVFLLRPGNVKDPDSIRARQRQANNCSAAVEVREALVSKLDPNELDGAEPRPAPSAP